MPAGVTQVISVADTTVILVAETPPKVTVAPVANSVPVIVTAVPPAVLPVFGLMSVIVGVDICTVGKLVLKLSDKIYLAH